MKNSDFPSVQSVMDYLTGRTGQKATGVEPAPESRGREARCAVSSGSASDTPRTDYALAYLKRENERGPKYTDIAGYSVMGVQKLIQTAKELERENGQLRKVAAPSADDEPRRT